jgi:hypothetical protein
MPAGEWYELDDDGHWTAHVHAACSVGNAHWRFFSSDTLYSNTGEAAAAESFKIGGLKLKGFKR